MNTTGSYSVKCNKCLRECVVSAFVYEIVKSSPNFFCSNCINLKEEKDVHEVGIITKKTITVMDAQQPNWNPDKQCYCRVCPSCKKVVNHLGKMSLLNCRWAIINGRTCRKCQKQNQGVKWTKHRKKQFSKQRTGKLNPVWGLHWKIPHRKKRRRNAKEQG